MSLVIAVLVALLVGFLVYLLCRLFPFSRSVAEPAGLIAAVLTFLFRAGGL